MGNEIGFWQAWGFLSQAELAMVIMYLTSGFLNLLFIVLWGLNRQKVKRLYGENVWLKQELRKAKDNNTNETAS